MSYKRRPVEKAIVMALRDLGGSADRKTIRKNIAENEYDGISYDDVYEARPTRSGGKYIPFNFDFGFGFTNLYNIGFIERIERGKDVILTGLGRTGDISHFPTKKQEQAMKAYWDKKHQLNNSKKNPETTEDDLNTNDEEDNQDTKFKSDLIDALKKFSPTKFESFSRLLISKMGVDFDKHLGVVRSGDHGIDGFGYFQSDEFRTSRVAIQCKRYTQGAVSEPEIDKFKGVMDGFNAEYGIFITTSHFTDRAREKATQGNNTVTLINGQELAELVQKYQLHITPITTYTLDDYYFEQD